jgi:hypothetical protein
MRVKLALDGMLLHIQRVKQAAEAEYFGWLEANVPELFSNKGRPHWIASEKVTGQDRALLKEFEDALAGNVAANGGKKYRASQKTYSDLADKYGYNDEESIKRRVMRARRRQKAFNDSLQDFQQILHGAARRETDRRRVITPKEYEINRERFLKAFRRIVKTR